MVRTLALLLTALLGASAASARSLHFRESRPTYYEFADLPRIPAGFGEGEFALELWIRPDAAFPVGPVWAPGYGQLRNWAAEDPKPYSSAMWWVSGNWLLDGFSRPDGFGPGDPREGSIGLQLYGGGRVRFTFADTNADMPRGGIHAVQAPVTAETPSLLDGKWHHVVAQRRWRDGGGATLELWVDGRRVGATDIPLRTDMRRFWDKPAHPSDPAKLGGWSLGAEVMTAWKYEVTQFEDYKGLVDNLRFWNSALDPARIAELSRGVSERDRPAAWFRFGEGRGARTLDRFDRSLAMTLHRFEPRHWSRQEGPIR